MKIKINCWLIGGCIIADLRCVYMLLSSHRESRLDAVHFLFQVLVRLYMSSVGFDDGDGTCRRLHNVHDRTPSKDRSMIRY